MSGEEIAVGVLLGVVAFVHFVAMLGFVPTIPEWELSRRIAGTKGLERLWWRSVRHAQS